MPREGPSQAESSLPSCLFPYLLQQCRDGVSNPSTTDRQVPPISLLTMNESPPQQSLAPDSVPPMSAFSYTSSPRFYPAYGRADVGTSIAGTSGVRHTLGNSNQVWPRHNSPIYSDPVYYTSQPSQTEPKHSFLQPTLREQFSRPGWTNWRERESRQTPLTYEQTDGPVWTEDGFSSSNVLTASVYTQGSRHSPEELPPPQGLFPSDSEPRKKGRREGEERPRKTAVACNFCRGRKLKCDGERPRCGVCGKRGLECEYVEKPKRRGPGKANKRANRGV